MKEVIHALETMTKTDDMENFIKRQDRIGCEFLVNALRYTDPDTESKWLEIYGNVFKL